MRYQLVLRAEFIPARYENFLKKKKYLEEVGLLEHCVLTDLDHIYEGETKPQKDLIICDRCNEYIEDAQFIMLEGQFVYHRACVKDELPPEFQDESKPVVFGGDFQLHLVKDQDNEG